MTQLNSALTLSRKQRSHLLFVWSNPKLDRKSRFLAWYQSAYRDAMLANDAVLNVQQYERHETDITAGRYAPIPFNYLGLHELSIDGAEAAGALIDRILEIHQEEGAAEPAATWLYYAVSEKVGRNPRNLPSMLTLAFANALAGQEAEFREWYATRHIRHALNVPALVSGQTFERTLFQRPGAAPSDFSTIAIYEQEGTPADILESFTSLPPDTFCFPAMDNDRFAESVYRPL